MRRMAHGDLPLRCQTSPEDAVDAGQKLAPLAPFGGISLSRWKYDPGGHHPRGASGRRMEPKPSPAGTINRPFGVAALAAVIGARRKSH